MKVKAGQDVINLIALAYKSNRRAIWIEGRHGCGKSDLVEAAAKHLGIDCIVRDLGLMDPPDLTGLPVHDHKNGVTRYLPPSFLPTGGNGLLVFEELNRCEKYMLGPCLQLLTARRLNDYVLPEGWCVCACGNPSSDGEYETNVLDPALLSRFMRIEIEPDVRQWLIWAEKHEVHPAVLRQVRNIPDIFSTSCPRSFKYLSDTLCAYEQSGDDNIDMLTVAACGILGSEAAGVSFVQNYLSAEEPLSAEIILSADYGKHRSEIQRQTKLCRTDLLASSLHSVCVRLQNTDTATLISKSDVLKKSLGDFASDIPADLAKRLRRAAKQAGIL
ncbi:MAG: hypothetical protein WCN95_08010 [bacterium]